MTDTMLTKREIPSFGKYTLITGIVLILLGMTGIILPAILALGTALFFGWLLLTAGIVWALHTFRYSPKNFLDWLKPFLLILCGCLIIFYPLTGIAAVSLLLAIYLMMDAFGSFSLAKAIHPGKGWGWMTFNGVTSLILAFLFLISGPVTSIWLIGIYIGISLFFDGFVLVTIGWKLKKAEQHGE
ncbi:MAG TPA: hypothetical protein ENI88_05640 [Desulfobulbus sp.]|nr:hypothetical protein [Desulfobulbus sp.]